MTRLSFRTRVLLYLVLFAVVPSSLLMLGGASIVSATLPLISSGGAWDSVATSGKRTVGALKTAPLTREQRAILAAHEQELDESLTQARRFRYVADRLVVLVATVALLGSLLLALIASRVAGHLSRQLSRPLRELVGWTELIGKGQRLPEGPPRRGAPEFEMLRRRMRKMADALEQARMTERESQRLEAFRETARRVAHELKNPLTPIRFAVERLRRDAPAALAEPVEVLATESRRLEEMARSFAQFGRLPEGPVAEIDVGELARYSARATVPESVPLALTVEEELPMVTGHYDALSRALSNVLINAVDACQDGGSVDVHVGRAATMEGGREAVVIQVHDGGCGIDAAQLARIWDPYVTTKPGGTGLGLAIVRQTLLAHGGAVEATSTREGGTTIRLVIPVNGAEPHVATRGNSELLQRGQDR
ncbi:MAG: HAMP domain-containing histidine kinase [Gemmatimonadota bacterium]|nr:HAMP domain-containing histidine kinase [Gemmatimonadota bacterium]